MNSDGWKSIHHLWFWKHQNYYFSLTLSSKSPPSISLERRFLNPLLSQNNRLHIACALLVLFIFPGDLLVAKLRHACTWSVRLGQAQVWYIKGTLDSCKGPVLKGDVFKLKTNVMYQLYLIQPFLAHDFFPLRRLISQSVLYPSFISFCHHISCISNATGHIFHILYQAVSLLKLTILIILYYNINASSWRTSIQEYELFPSKHCPSEV